MCDGIYTIRATMHRNTQPSDVSLPRTTRIRRRRVLLNCCVADPSILLAAVEFRGLRYIAKKKMMIPAGGILTWCLPIKVEAMIHTVGSRVILLN